MFGVADYAVYYVEHLHYYNIQHWTLLVPRRIVMHQEHYFRAHLGLDGSSYFHLPRKTYRKQLDRLHLFAAKHTAKIQR